MDLNPLSLLEVTMGGEPDQNGDDDDCVIIEQPIPVHDITDDDTFQETEQEIMNVMGESTGVHFLQPAQDPLAPPTRDGNISHQYVTAHMSRLANPTKAEMQFRYTNYRDEQTVLRLRLHCTICQDHVGCDSRVPAEAIEHPVLKVLVCIRCANYLSCIQFTLNDQGKETRCRWCGQSPMTGGHPLRRCIKCPFSFCEKCLKQNFPVLPNKNLLWTCCVCNLKDLWPARGLLWAVQLVKQNPGPSTAEIDKSTCCKGNSCIRTCGEQGRHKPGPMREVNPQPTSHQLPSQVIVNGTPMLRPKVFSLPIFTNQNLGTGGQIIRLPSLGSDSALRPPPPTVLTKVTRPRRPPTPHVPSNSIPRETISPAHEQEQPPLPNCENDVVSTVWLRNKLDWYIRGIDSLKNRLMSARGKIPENDSVKKIQQLTDTMSTLLELNASLLRDSGVSLRNDWRERKTRHMIDKLCTSGLPEVDQNEDGAWTPALFADSPRPSDSSHRVLNGNRQNAVNLPPADMTPPARQNAISLTPPDTTAPPRRVATPHPVRPPALNPNVPSNVENSALPPDRKPVLSPNTRSKSSSSHTQMPDSSPSSSNTRQNSDSLPARLQDSMPHSSNTETENVKPFRRPVQRYRGPLANLDADSTNEVVVSPKKRSRKTRRLAPRKKRNNVKASPQPQTHVDIEATPQPQTHVDIKAISQPQTLDNEELKRLCLTKKCYVKLRRLESDPSLRGYIRNNIKRE